MKTLREMILERIDALMQYPYNGCYAFSDYGGSIPKDADLGSYSDQELLQAFEIVCCKAYRQR